MKEDNEKISEMTLKVEFETMVKETSSIDLNSWDDIYHKLYAETFYYCVNALYYTSQKASHISTKLATSIANQILFDRMFGYYVEPGLRIGNIIQMFNLAYVEDIPVTITGHYYSTEVEDVVFITFDGNEEICIPLRDTMYSPNTNSFWFDKWNSFIRR